MIAPDKTPDWFEVAFVKTMANEGYQELSNDKMDSGGMTFSGISRVYWPDWAGWPIIDQWISAPPGSPFPVELEKLTKLFYRQNFWNRFQGDAIAALAPEIAIEMFDTAVNLGITRAVEMLQAGYNVARGLYWSDIEVDGLIGEETIRALTGYLSSSPGSKSDNLQILLNCMNGEQYIYYKSRPKRRYFRGWFKRV